MLPSPVCSGKPPEVGGSQDWSRVILKLKPVQHPPQASLVFLCQGSRDNRLTSLLNLGYRQLVLGIRLCPSQALDALPMGNRGCTHFISVYTGASLNSKCYCL